MRVVHHRVLPESAMGRTNTGELHDLEGFPRDRSILGVNYAGLNASGKETLSERYERGKDFTSDSAAALSKGLFPFGKGELF